MQSRHPYRLMAAITAALALSFARRRKCYVLRKIAGAAIHSSS
jgi:hypothetical protein